MVARPGPGGSPAGRKQARTGRSGGRAAGTGFQAPSAPLRARALERPGAEALQQALHTHPTLQRTPAPVYSSPLGSQRSGQGPAQRRNPARPALRPQTEDLRWGGAVGTDAGVRPQAACRTPWQLGPGRRLLRRLRGALHIWAPTRALLTSLRITTLIIQGLGGQ